jgi:hypothetical protein
MLDALLATIGTLAILASIAAKLILMRGGTAAHDAASEDDPADAVAASSCTRSACPSHRARRGARYPSLHG